MTLVGDPPAPPVVDRPGLLRRLWALPLGAHVGALAMVLLALVPVIGTSSSFSTDEGAAIVQARSLSRGGGWVVEHPMPEVDPDGRHYPLELSERGERGFVPYGKHPLYPLLLAGADELGGVTAMVLLSLGGTLAAVGLAGALARRIDGSLARPTVWTVGLASPLLFDGFLVMAHTLAAAAATGAVLAAVVAIERASARRAWVVAPMVAAGVLLRTEAVFLAGALTVVALVAAVRRRDVRVPAVAVALASCVAGGGAYLVEVWWQGLVLGGEVATVRPVPAAADPGGFLSGRWDGFLRTVLTPTYGGNPLVALLLLTVVAALVVSVRSRRGPDGAAAGVATAASLLVLVTAPWTVVPGLLAAFPVAAAGLVLVRRSTLRTTGARIALGVFGLFALSVIGSQYAVGGATEWGGRFFALGVPLLVPVVLLALKERALDRWVAGSLVVCSLALATLAVTSLRHQHRRLGQLVSTAGAVETGEERPIMVATYGSVPRWAWGTADRQRWLISQPADLSALLDRLRDAGVRRIGLVTPHQARDRALLDASQVVSSEAVELARGWHILVVALS